MEIKITKVSPNKIGFSTSQNNLDWKVEVEILEQANEEFYLAMGGVVNPVCALGWLGDEWSGEVSLKQVSIFWAEDSFAATTTIVKSTPMEPLQPFTLRKVSADRLQEPDHAAYLSALERLIDAAKDYVAGVREVAKPEALEEVNE